MIFLGIYSTKNAEGDNVRETLYTLGLNTIQSNKSICLRFELIVFK